MNTRVSSAMAMVVQAHMNQIDKELARKAKYLSDMRYLLFGVWDKD